MPKVHIDVDLNLTTDKLRFDVLSIRGRHLPPNTAFTTFLIEQMGSPFGAAEYIADLTSNRGGNTHNEFRLIVQEAFSSTLVNGQRVRVDLNYVGAWSPTLPAMTSAWVRTARSRRSTVTTKRESRHSTPATPPLPPHSSI